MEYFNFLPKITYDNIYTIRNLFYKYYFSETIPSEYLYSYILADGESLESISFDVYNDINYWWLLAIINDIRDIIFELPLQTEVLQKIATDQSTIEGVLDLELFSENYDELETENDLKRNIKILKPIHLNDVLSNIIKES